MREQNTVRVVFHFDWGDKVFQKLMKCEDFFIRENFILLRRLFFFFIIKSGQYHPDLFGSQKKYQNEL